LQTVAIMSKPGGKQTVKPSGSKSKQAAGGSKSKKSNDADFLKTDEVLQAVVLADSFKVKLRPLTLDTPKVLLPLVNVPMLDYTLEFLVSGGVQEIFVFAVAHAQQIADYIAKSKWSRLAPLHTIKVLMSKDCTSAGEALRHLDSLDVIKGDFILLSGDVVSNIKLDKVLKAHKERVKADKYNIMTMVLKNAEPGHRTRTLDDDMVVAMDSKTGHLLHYDNNASSGVVSTDLEVLSQAQGDIEFRYDLMDSHIDICTPEVLMLFTDNFDFEDIREDFVKGIIGMAEVTGHKIATHVISGEYAARMQDLRTYDSISKDVIHRWSYPLVPDHNLVGDTHYTFARGNIYKELQGLTLARSCRLVEDVVIGSGCSVGDNTVIAHSVIGRNVKIGANCRIENSYVWGDCVLGDGVVLTHAIVANGVTIRAGAKIGAGSVLSFNVTIGAHHVVPPYAKLTTAALPHDDDDDFASDDDDEDEAEPGAKSQSQTAVQLTDDDEWDEAVVGQGGVGRLYVEKIDEEDEDAVAASEVEKKFHLNSLAPTKEALLMTTHPLPADEEDAYLGGEGFEEDDEEETKEGADGEHKESLDAKELITDDDTLDANLAKFYNEVRETIRRGDDERLDVDAIVLEVASLKMVHHPSLSHYVGAVMTAMWCLAKGLPPAGPDVAYTATKDMLTSLRKALLHWCPILSKFCKQEEDQPHIMKGLRRACLYEAGRFAPLFSLTLQTLYEQEVLAEEAVLAWDEEMQSASEGPEKALWKRCSTFVTWLKEAEEESDEEDEDDD